MANKPKTPAQVAAEKKVAAEQAKVNAQKNAANKAKVDANKQKNAENAKKVSANKTANTPKPKPTTTYKPNKPAQTIKLTPNKATSKPSPSPEKYRYFMGTKDMSQPTKEVNRATFEKGGMPRTKILASDTSKINNITRSYGASSSKGFVPLKTKTTPKKP